MEKKISVGIVEPVGGHGGMDYYDYGLAMGLGNAGVFVRYYTCNQTNIREYHNTETIVCFRNMWKRNFVIKSLKYLYGHFFAIKDLKKHNINIIHLHFFTFRSIDLIILLFAKLYRLNTVATIHDINSFDKKANSFIEDLCMKLINGIIVHNQTSFNVLNLKKKYIVPIRIIPHGNYLPFINLNTIDSIPNDKFSILFFGQIKKVKGLDILLHAIKKVKHEGYNCELIIAGKAWKSDLNEYHDLINDLEIKDYIKTDFRYIPDSEVVGFYNKADIIVLPYKSIYQSGVLLLSLSYGKPVLCSDLEPFKEIINDNENGFLFKSEDSEDLALKIIKLIDNPTLLTKVVEKSNIIIRDKYNWNTIGKLTCQFYAEILSS